MDYVERIGDEKIKRFCMKNRYPIPTNEQLKEFPDKFRDFDGKDEASQLHMGLQLLMWLKEKVK
jgi:hypothetical protein